jgi:simple sugar transport system permease protein
MKKNNLLRNSGVQSLLASLMCILVGLLVGYVALLIINAEGAWEAISNIVKNFICISLITTAIIVFVNHLVHSVCEFYAHYLVNLFKFLNCLGQ